MASTNKTPNFDLPQFIATDKPSWLGDINGAFLAIDTALQANKVAIDSTESSATSAQGSAAAAKVSADSAAKSAETATSTATLAQTTANAAQTAAASAQQTADTAKQTAESAQTNATRAQTTATQAQQTASAAQTTAGAAQTSAIAANNNAQTALTQLQGLTKWYKHMSGNSDQGRNLLYNPTLDIVISQGRAIRVTTNPTMQIGGDNVWCAINTLTDTDFYKNLPLPILPISFDQNEWDYDISGDNSYIFGTCHPLTTPPTYVTSSFPATLTGFIMKVTTGILYGCYSRNTVTTNMIVDLKGVGLRYL